MTNIPSIGGNAKSVLLKPKESTNAPQVSSRVDELNKYLIESSNGLLYPVQNAANEEILGLFKKAGIVLDSNKTLEQFNNEMRFNNGTSTPKFTTSEHIAYAMLSAVKNNDEETFMELFKTVKYLSDLNYKKEESSETLKLLPWVVVETPNGLQIPKVPGERHVANASAADADLDLLAALVMGVQKANQNGWKNNAEEQIRNFFDTYVKQFRDQVVHYYIDSDLAIMSAGGFISKEQESRSFDSNQVDEIIDNVLANYPNEEIDKYKNFFKKNLLVSTNAGSYELIGDGATLVKRFDNENFIALDFLILNDIYGVFDQKAKTWTVYYPSYPNLEYLQYIAEYFTPHSNMDKGHKNLHEYFIHLIDSTKRINQKLVEELSKGSSKQQIIPPVRVKVSTEGDNEIIFKEFYLPSENDAYADRFRLEWRSPEFYNAIYPNGLQYEVDTQNSSYYSFLKEGLVNMDIRKEAPITVYYKSSDAVPDSNRNDTNIQTHWGFNRGYFADLVEGRQYWLCETISSLDCSFEKTTYNLDPKNYSKVPQSRRMHYNSTPIRTQFSQAMELCSNPITLSRGIDEFEKAFERQLQKDKVEHTMLSTIWEKPLAFLQELAPSVSFLDAPYLNEIAEKELNIEIVSYYLDMLKTMKGATNKDLKIAITRLIALAKDKQNFNNAFLKALYLELILLWDILEPSDKTYLEDIVIGEDDVFGLRPILENKKDKYSNKEAVYTYNDISMIAPFDMIYNSSSKDEKGNYIITYSKLDAFPMSTLLKEDYLEEIIKRDMKDFLSKSQKDSKSLYIEFSKYINNLSQKHKYYVFSMAIYYNIFSDEEKIKLIDYFLNELDKSNPREYMKNYLAIYLAYQFMLFEKIKSYPSNSEYYQKFVDFSSFLIENNSEVNKKYSGDIHDRIYKKFDRDIYEEFILDNNSEYINLVSQSITLAFWAKYQQRDMNNNMSIELDKIVKKNIELYQTNLPNDWEESPRFLAALYRVNLEEMLENIKNGKETLQKFSDTAKKYYSKLEGFQEYLGIERNDDAYAEVTGTMIFILNQLSYSDIENKEIKIKELTNDNIFSIKNITGQFVFNYVLKFLSINNTDN
jgi:hypothetical protein